MKYVWVIKFEKGVKVQHEYLKDYDTFHLHAVGDTIEDVLKACREKYPESVVKGIERTSHYHGLPLLQS